MIGNLKFERLENYEVKGVVAQRRHGVLFEGYDPTHDRPVLLNVWTDMALDGDLRERFEQHTHKLMEFQHPNILGILDLGVDLEQHLAWWVMPFVSGAFLEERLGTRWAVSEAVRVAAEVAQALDYASQKGVLHQALYPENILLTERGWSLVMDFGMMAFLEEEPEAAMIAYWAPERLQGTAGQLTSDLYAVGVILYEMLAGQLPFAADNVGALAERQLQGPRPLRKIRSDVPREVDAIVLQLLAGDPHLRFSDGAVLARSLVEALPPDGSRSSRPITPPPGIGGKSNFVSESIKRPEPVATTSFWPKFGSVLWRTTRWILRRVVTVSVILVLLLVALLVGTTFLVSTVLEQRLATYHWNLEGWERGGKSYVLEEYLTTPLRQVIEPYTLGALTDLGVDFYAPDRVELHGRFRECPISLTIGLYTDAGIPQLQLRQYDGFPLYVIGGILSDGINRGLTTSWQEVPVRLSVFQVENDGISVVLVPMVSQSKE